MPMGDIYKVTIIGELHGSATNNVLHFEGSNNLATLVDIVTQVIDCVRTALLPALSNEWILRGVKGQTIHPVLSDEHFIGGNPGDVGSVVNEGLPAMSAGLIQIRTGLGGRRNRGRIFIAGIPENGHNTTRLTTPELALLAAFATCLANKFISANSVHPYYLGVLSRKTIQAGQNIPQSFKRATVLTTTNLLASQRRRRPGVGA